MIFYITCQVRGNKSNHLKDDLMSHVNIMLLCPSIPPELVDDYEILGHHDAIYWGSSPLGVFHMVNNGLWD